MASRTALRQGSSWASTVLATTPVRSSRKRPNSSRRPEGGAGASTSPSRRRTSSAETARSSRSCIAKTLFNAPPSSRTFFTGWRASASATPCSRLLARLVGLAADDGDAGLVLRNPDVHDQPAGEARQQPRVEPVDVGRRAVRGEDDLAPGRGQVVERAQQHLLRLVLSGEELHVVEEEDVEIRVAVAEGVARAPLQRPRELLQVTLQRHVLDLPVRSHPHGVVRDRHEDVGLTESGRRIHEERVVARSRGVRGATCCGAGQPIGRADHEGVERQFRIEIRHERRGLGSTQAKV